MTPDELDLASLRALAVAIEEGTITAAARRLYVTQPALSRRIASLERALGARLIVRQRSGGIAPTPAGLEVVRRSADLLHASEELIEAVAALARDAERTLRIGYWLPSELDLVRRAVDLWSATEEGRHVVFVRSDFDDPSAGLRSRAVDVAVAIQGLEPAGADFHPLRIEPLVIAARDGHPLADRTAISLSEAFEYPWVALPASAGAFRDFWLATEFRTAPARIDTVVARFDDGLAHLALSDAVALVTSAATSLGAPYVRYVPLADPLVVHYGLAWFDDSPAAASFVAALHAAGA